MSLLHVAASAGVVVGVDVTVGAGVAIGVDIVVGTGIAIYSGGVIDANTAVGADLTVGVVINVAMDVTMYVSIAVGIYIVLGRCRSRGADGCLDKGCGKNECCNGCCNIYRTAVGVCIVVDGYRSCGEYYFLNQCRTPGYLTTGSK